MRKPTYHQINPLIRLKETELLSEQQFQQLLEAETVEDVKNMLKSTVYQPYLTETFEEKFDYHSSEALGSLYRWLYEMAPEPAVVTLYTMRFTFHNLTIFPICTLILLCIIKYFVQLLFQHFFQSHLNRFRLYHYDLGLK